MSSGRLLPRTDDLDPLPLWGQRVLRPVGRGVYGSRYALEVHGRDRVPQHGPVLLAANHIGYLDGPLVMTAAPRPTHALVKQEMFHGWMGRLLTAAGQIPVDRFDVDVRAVRQSVCALRTGRAVVVFPEANRGAGDVATTRRGLAYLALVTGAPVVPVAVLGSRWAGESVHSKPQRGTRLVVAFGDPVPVAAEPWPRRSDRVRDLAERLRETLAAHVSSTVARTGVTLPGPAPDADDHPDEIGAAL